MSPPEIIDTCPRRNNEIGAWQYGENLDGWDRQRGDEELHCIFCGSLHPDYVLTVMAAGKCTLGPTDKNYKIYVDVPEDHVISKFYFQHLNKEQCKRFVGLYNMKNRPFRISYPFDFYEMPFFMIRGEDVGLPS